MSNGWRLDMSYRESKYGGQWQQPADCKQREQQQRESQGFNAVRNGDICRRRMASSSNGGALIAPSLARVQLSVKPEHARVYGRKAHKRAATHTLSDVTQRTKARPTVSKVYRDVGLVQRGASRTQCLIEVAGWELKMLESRDQGSVAGRQRELRTAYQKKNSTDRAIRFLPLLDF